MAEGLHIYTKGERVRIYSGALGTVEFGDATGANVIEDDGDIAWFVAADIESVENTEDTVRVWVAEHDDEDVEYVVNDEEDMRGNYEDLQDQNLAFLGSFENYLDSWHSFDMPRRVFDSPDQQDRIDWIDLNK